ncbi:hypothetical protein PAE9249_01805 [Paenibacillus sp. CECT 9249]|uniref:YhgE/Pip domain-containing protein n=1 Tax=Paenibacillus sp. CECT 9249 TaxID=2845385 RepID=UPI001E2BA673|nr:ABC transporter permease [Paenibacillus sp. CECT 9249]CAH0119306.1 hypothetical protein PAE9249_01805 [Paenibacillus sp. CECT 9249]
MFQIIFSVVWTTGYDGITDNIRQLRVAIVNEDQGFGMVLTERMREALPAQAVSYSSLDDARRDLNERRVHMVVHILSSFSAQLQTPDQLAEIRYYTNDSNSSLIRSMMHGMADGLTKNANREAVSMAIAQWAGTAGNMPADQAQIIGRQLSERVASKLQADHPVRGMNNQMAPLMLVLASFVGAMIMGMNMEQSSRSLPHIGRWQRFAVRGMINTIVAVLASLVGCTLFWAFGGQMEHGFVSVWAFQSLVMVTFLFVAQMFLLLFGMGGMLFNILALSVQLVASGGLVPTELLSGFYRSISGFLPATYAVEGQMNLLFGGPGVQSAAGYLGLILLVSAVIGLLGVAIRGRRTTIQAEPSAAV